MKKATLTIAAALGMSFVASQVQAGALATSVVKFENFTATWVGTGTQVDFADFDTLTYTGSADVGADLNSVGGNASDSDTSSDGALLDLFVSEGNIGATGANYSDNDFTEISSTGGFPTSNFAIGDSNEVGAPITNLPDGNGGVAASNADLANASYVSIETGSDVGSASSNNGLTASIEFILATNVNGEIRFDFDIDTFLEVFLDSGEVAPSFAQASWEISFSIEDLTAGTFVLDFGISCDASRTAPLGANGIPSDGGISGDCETPDGSYSATTLGLTAGNEYELTARILTAADAQIVRVPEPSMTAIFGAGLLSLGLLGFSRRRQAQS